MASLAISVGKNAIQFLWLNARAAVKNKDKCVVLATRADLLQDTIDQQLPSDLQENMLVARALERFNEVTQTCVEVVGMCGATSKAANLLKGQSLRDKLDECDAKLSNARQDLMLQLMWTVCDSSTGKVRSPDALLSIEEAYQKIPGYQVGQWGWQGDDGLKPYDEDINGRLEVAWLNRSKPISVAVGDQLFDIDVIGMVQTGRSTKGVRSVFRREVVANARPTVCYMCGGDAMDRSQSIAAVTRVTWHVALDHGWVAFECSASATMEVAYQSGLTGVGVPLGKELTPYWIDFKNMCQQNLLTRFQRHIRREQAPMTTTSNVAYSRSNSGFSVRHEHHVDAQSMSPSGAVGQAAVGQAAVGQAAVGQAAVGQALALGSDAQWVWEFITPTGQWVRFPDASSRAIECAFVAKQPTALQGVVTASGGALDVNIADWKHTCRTDGFVGGIRRLLTKPGASPVHTQEGPINPSASGR